MFPLFIITFAFSILTALFAPSQKATRGQLKDFTFPQIGDGDPLIYAAGTVKITAPGLVWYGDFSSKALHPASNPLGGLIMFLLPKPTVGYRYYLGWQLVVCIGPNARLKRLWFGTISDKDEAQDEENDPNFTDPNDPKVPTPIFSGDVGTGHMQLTNLKAFGGDVGKGGGGQQGGGGYDLSVDFYGGEQSQGVNTYLEAKINGLIPAWRGICHMVVHGYIGDSTTLQNMTMEIERIYDPLALGGKARVGSEGDANPANVIYELLTNNFGAASMPINRIKTQSFLDAGSTLFDEDEGISITFGGSGAADKVGKVIQDVLRQIDAVLYEDPLDGLVYLKLIRQDYTLADLPIINVENIADLQNFALNLWSDTKNRVRVSYEDRKKDYNSRVAVGEDMANVAFQNGQVKGVNVQHPYVKRKEHANRLVVREMAIYSTILTKVTAATQRFNLALRPGSVVKFTFGPYNIEQVIMRILKVNFGSLTNNRMVLDMAADKFAAVDLLFSPPTTDFVRPNTGATNIRTWNIEESPRWLNLIQPDLVNADAPRALVLPFPSNQAQQGYNLWLKTPAETEYQQTNTQNLYPETATISGALAMEYATTSITFSDISNVDVLANVSATQISQFGYNLILVDQEFMAFETYALVGSDYVVSTVHRGLLDSVVAAHASGAKAIFVRAFHVGSREFIDGDTIDIKMGSFSPSGEQTVAEAASATL